MGNRSTLKFLRDFSKRELEKKKADRVFVQRVKMESSFRRGKYPSMRVKKIEEVFYLVCSFRTETMRVYFFGKDGDMRGAKNYTGDDAESFWDEISKQTKNVFKFSKK